MACKRVPWIQDELRRRGLRPSVGSSEVNGESLPWIQDELRRGRLCPVVGSSEVKHDNKESKRTQAKRTYYNPMEKEAMAMDIPIATAGSNLISQYESALVTLLKACAKQKDLYKGSKLHEHILQHRSYKNNIYIGNTLVNMYVKCGALTKAKEVFDNLPVRDVISWTALVAGYTQHGHGQDAVKCFEQMKREGLSPDLVTFACALKACGAVGAAAKGREIHADIITKGFLGSDPVLGNALVDMYVKCGALPKAQQVLDELPIRNVISWTALITGYCQNEQGEEAFSCLERMTEEGLCPNAMTFSCILKACGGTGAAEKGMEVHAEIARKGLLREDVVLGNAVVDMYAKCGALEKAQEVFDELLTRDLVSWNVLIAGYAQHGQGEEALNCYEEMKHAGVSPDAATFACVLKSCSSIGATEKGKEIHVEIVRKQLLGKNIVLGNVLVDMYAKCGVLSKAQQVFDELLVRDVISWTALITGYCEHGHGEEALSCFKRMVWEGMLPNAITLACILKACGTVGAAEKGQSFFETMSASYGIMPTLGHHACMVALFGHAGNFDKAMSVIKKMPSCDYLPAWFALLGACCKWGNVKLGRLAFEHAVRLQEKSTVAYVYMSKVYAAAGMQEDAEKIKAMRLQVEA